MLPVADAALRASEADGAILVVRHGKTTKDQADQARQRLNSVGAALLGTVLNFAPARAKGYGYSYGYGYGYAPKPGTIIGESADDSAPAETPSPNPAVSEDSTEPESPVVLEGPEHLGNGKHLDTTRDAEPAVGAPAEAATSTPK